MNEEYEEVLKRHGVSKPGFVNQKKALEEMAKSLLHQEEDLNYYRRHIRSLEDELDEKNYKIKEITGDCFGGLEPIEEIDEEDGKKYFIGVKSLEKMKFYIAGCSPTDRENIKELKILREDISMLSARLGELEADNKKKKKERDRALSRAVSAEEKLQTYITSQGYYVEGDGIKGPIPFKIEVMDRCVAEIRASHGKIMLCKNKNSSWFFEFGELYVEETSLKQTNTKGIELLPNKSIFIKYWVEAYPFTESYCLRKKNK